MANSITTMIAYAPLLDAVYKENSLTSVLDSNENLLRLVGKEFKVAEQVLDGLASHVRTGGGAYVDGGATLTWRSYTPDYDRNRKFVIDTQDNVETAEIAFGTISGEFIRTKVVPEVDAYRFAKLATLAGTKVGADLSTTAEFLAAVLVAINAMDEEEVPQEGRWLFATPTLINGIMALDTTESREVIAYFGDRIRKVPQTRFYTAITLADGVTAGQEAGGYAKTGGAKDLNFLVVHPSAVISGLKHVAPKYIPASASESYDGDGFAYRIYGLTSVLKIKEKAIYAHSKA